MTANFSLQFSCRFVADVWKSKIKEPTIKEKFILLQFCFSFIAVVWLLSLHVNDDIMCREVKADVIN